MTTVTYTASGSWTAPAGVTSVDCQCWGGGGGGGGSTPTQANFGSSGGGGEFAEETTLAVTPGNVYTFTIGAAGSAGSSSGTSGGAGGSTTFPGDSVTVTAHGGGGGGNGNSPGSAAGGTGSANSVHHNGGAGGSGAGAGAAGGGGSGGTGSAGNAGPGGASGGAAGATAVTGGGPGGNGGANNQAGHAPASGPGGGGGGSGANSVAAAGGAGFAGQITLTYTSSASHPGTGTLSGIGTITGAWQFLGAGTLSGTGTITAAGSVSTLTATALSGTGTITAAAGTTRPRAAALSGTGSLSAHTIGFTGAPLSGIGTLRAVQAREFRATLTGLGTVGVPGVTLGFSAALSGTGTIGVTRVLGVVTAGASRGVVTTPQAWPGSSQVAVSAPGSSRLYWLGTLGQVTALTYSYVCPGGADKMSCTIAVPAAYRTQLFNPGWKVQVFRGGHQVWDGKLDEPQPTPQGWNLTAVGSGNLGQNFEAIFSSTWPAGEPDQAINNAISRGLPWANPGVGTPAGAWYGQAPDSGSQNIADLLNLVCSRGGLVWYVNPQPGGTLADDLSVFPLPATVNRRLVATTPVGRTLGADINTIYLRYQATADNAQTGAVATYALTSVTNTASATAHGVMETFIDISDAGVISAGQAQTVGNYVLQVYQRASFAGPFTVHYGEFLNTGGQPIDLGTDQAGTVAQLILTDYGYGGEVTPGPISFIVGAYEYNDFTQTAAVTPYQTLNHSLTGLLSLENTLLQPVTAAG